MLVGMNMNIQMYVFQKMTAKQLEFWLIIFVLLALKLDGDELLSEQQRVEINNLAFSWDLPAFKPTNRRWLFQQMMQHAVRL